MIEDVLENDYDVSIISADVVTILWAIDRALKFVEPHEVKKELKAINRKREKQGKMVVYIPYGHELFNV